MKLNKNMWDVLKSDLERNATGATIHDVRLKFAWTKDRIEFWCMHQHEPNRKISFWENNSQMLHDYLEECIDGASKQLKIYGYDDWKLFITDS